MFRYSFSDFYWLYLFTVLGLSILFYIIKLLTKKYFGFSEGKTLIYFFLIALSFSFLGLTIGLLIGLSISPVIGVVIPALLTFFGGFITYVFIFGNKTTEEGLLMATIIISLSFFLILGSDYGAATRGFYEKKKAEYDEAIKKEFEILKHNLNKENMNYDLPSSKANEHLPIDTIAKAQDRNY